jgi:hypothetical protein
MQVNSKPSMLNDLKSSLNLPFPVLIGEDEYAMRVLSVSEIFEVLERLQFEQIKVKSNNMADVLDLDHNGKIELKKQLMAEHKGITLNSFQDIFASILDHITIADIKVVLAFILSKCNNKSYKDFIQILDMAINLNNITTYINLVIKVLGLANENETGETLETDETDETDETQNETPKTNSTLEKKV